MQDNSQLSSETGGLSGRLNQAPKTIDSLQLKSTSHPEPASLPALQIQSRYSLGQSVLSAHGIDASKERIMICNSYVTGAFSEGVVPSNLLPDPTGDAYLHFTAAPTLSAGEVLVALNFQPGILDHYRNIGLLPAEAQVIELNPDRRLQVKPGYPHTNPLSLLDDSSERPQSTYFVATFPSENARCQAGSHGCLSVQNFDPEYLNNKANFRIDSEEHGYKMLPGFVLESDDDFERLEDFSANKCWIKLATGSGGDLVRSFDRSSEGGLHTAIAAIREAVQSAFQNAEFPEPGSFQNFWPEDSVLPKGAKLVVEQDARSLGPLIVNGSMNVLLKRDGTFELIDCFRQNTGPDGSYRGSERFELRSVSPELEAAVLSEAEKVFSYAHEHGLRGYVGFDFFALGTPDAPQVRCIELNARPTMSSVPALTAKKLQNQAAGRHNNYVNVNITADRSLLSFDDFQQVFTLDGIDLTDPGNASGITVTPLALRSLHTQGADGEIEWLVSSPKAKILVTAEQTTDAWAMLDRLERLGKISLGE